MNSRPIATGLAFTLALVHVSVLANSQNPAVQFLEVLTILALLLLMVLAQTARR